MKLTFHSPGDGLCTATLFASGRYGFSLPKRVEIVGPSGRSRVFLYRINHEVWSGPLSKPMLIKIAIEQFLRSNAEQGEKIAELDPTLPPYQGELRSLPPGPRYAPLRVRAGTVEARARPVRPLEESC